jgi:hypothetical protein
MRKGWKATRIGLLMECCEKAEMSTMLLSGNLQTDLVGAGVVGVAATVSDTLNHC